MYLFGMTGPDPESYDRQILCYVCMYIHVAAHSQEQCVVHILYREQMSCIYTMYDRRVHCGRFGSHSEAWTMWVLVCILPHCVY